MAVASTKVLGQSAPGATTETVLYTVPTDTHVVCSSLIICNRGAGVGTVRVSISVGGGATANKDYIYYDLSVSPNISYEAVLGLTMDEGDKIRVYASTGDFSFNLFGQELQ